MHWLVILLLSLPLGLIAQHASEGDSNGVLILRDQWGVPHIEAESPADASYGLAWAMAEDQFHAMQAFVAMGQGRLGLLWGVSGLTVDYFRAWSGIEEQAQADLCTRLSPELYSMFESYAQALNDYARIHPKEIRLKSLFPVEALDLVCGGLVVQYAAMGVPDALESIRRRRPDQFIVRPGALGSNAFAFRADQTTYGATTLIMNPHVPLYGFISLYEAQLHIKGRLPVHGAFVAGLPFPMLGANPAFAWSVTYNWPDLVDIYRLKPNGRKKIELDGEAKQLVKRYFKLHFRLAGLPLTFRWRAFDAPHGPVFSWMGPKYALRFPQANPLGAFETWYRLSTCSTLEEARECFQTPALPTFTFVAVDYQDRIALWYNALIPDRPDGWDWQRVLPGDRSELIWNRYMPFDSLPQYWNPGCGYVYNTNNSPFFNTCPDEWLDSLKYSRSAGFGWNRENSRALRIRELLYDSLPVDSLRLHRLKWDPCWPAGGAMRSLFQRFQQLNRGHWPQLADEIDWLNRWDGCGDTLNRHASLPLLAIYFLFDRKKGAILEIETGLNATDEELVAALRKASRHLRRTFGTYDVPLGHVQVIRRNEQDYPMSGLPDALQSVYTYLNDRGRLQMTIGEHFTAKVLYRNGKLDRLETVVPFGSSSRQTSSHYADQTPLFIQGRLKSVTFDLEMLRLDASRVYRPGHRPFHP